MLYICTHVATVGVKGLNIRCHIIITHREMIASQTIEVEILHVKIIRSTASKVVMMYLGCARNGISSHIKLHPCERDRRERIARRSLWSW